MPRLLPLLCGCVLALVTAACATRLGGAAPAGARALPRDPASLSASAAETLGPDAVDGLSHRPGTPAAALRQSWAFTGPRIGYGSAGDAAAAGAAPGAPAGGGEAAGADLAKASQNPVGDLISLPFQNNTNFDVGPLDKTQNVLNIQPVIPVKLGCGWNLINRLIVPVVWQEEDAIPGIDEQFGLGDTLYTGFLSPRAPSKLIWGAGPALLIPTATEDVLGTEKWAAGPSVVALAMPGSWVVGVLASNIWSFAGAEDRADVNQLNVQLFATYNMPCGWFITSSPIITANWEADADERWTVPLGGGFGRVTKWGRQPISWSVQAYTNIEHPTAAGEWTLRLSLSFLFPKKP